MVQHHILVLGAGRIGTLIAHWLSAQDDYYVWLGDLRFTASEIKKNLTSIPLDAANSDAVSSFLKSQPAISTIVSSLPYYCNKTVAGLAKQHHLNYFDLTEDLHVMHYIQELAVDYDRAFVPQCGLAPGIINIISSELMDSFQELEHAKLRVGALPLMTDNALHYALTWSTDGLINQYGNPCMAIRDMQLTMLQPLEGLETLALDGQEYEAFNTSGGLGSMATDYVGKIEALDYKTLRYPGHCEKMRFLMNDLKLNNQRTLLKQVLEHALPNVSDDVVILYVSIQGKQNEQSTEKHYVKKFYGQMMWDVSWSAIQLTTAAGLCAVLEEVLSHPQDYKGYVKQHDFVWSQIIQNRFGRYFSV